MDVTSGGENYYLFKYLHQDICRGTKKLYKKGFSVVYHIKPNVSYWNTVKFPEEKKRKK